MPELDANAAGALVDRLELLRLIARARAAHPDVPLEQLADTVADLVTAYLEEGRS